MLKDNYPGVSRREFLTTTAGAGGAMLLVPAWLNAAADGGNPGGDPRVAQVMSKTIGIDMHNHVYPRGPNLNLSRLNRGGPRSNHRLPTFSLQKRSNGQG